ncbi:hypothetical protein [Rhizobium sp. HT1-10]|uniref:hypothetical protein n=1 Tax=Rhizobium sp. HT1-10 TaxID=3111638 RepID=UPI003C240762
MDLIHNERIKLLATFLNSVGVAVFAVGGLSPLFAMLSGADQVKPSVMVISGICFFTAFGLHYSGSRVLQRMKP